MGIGDEYFQQKLRMRNDGFEDLIQVAVPCILFFVGRGFGTMSAMAWVAVVFDSCGLKNKICKYELILVPVPVSSLK